MNAQPKKKVLFVCVENANRSQMAESFARLHGGEDVEAFSAGSRPGGTVNPKAVAAMAERGYDLSRHASKSLDDLPAGVEFDFVATMGCGDACPLVRARRREDWAIADPKHLEPQAFRAVRDDIESRVKAMLASFHALRHTATSLLKNAGVSDVVAREFVGHESAAVSKQYTHIETATLRAAGEKLPDILSPDAVSTPRGKVR